MMKGIVIHSRGHFRRCLDGRDNEGQITVKTIMPVPPPPGGEETAPGGMPPEQQRPVHFVFYYNGKAFAGSHRVILRKGRRYPNVEHWFILSSEPSREGSLTPNQFAVAGFEGEASPAYTV